MAFRMNVTHKYDKVWSVNRNKDLYTSKSKGKLEDTEDVEVDHVVEVQLGEHIWDNLDGRLTTRGRLKPVKELWNSVANLNNTADWLNQAKGNAFSAWIKGKEEDLRSALSRYNIGSNIRTKIVVAFEEKAEYIQDELADIAEDKGLDVYHEVAGDLGYWAQKTG